MKAGQGIDLPSADSLTAPHRRILLVVVALIVYGSLYPWQFHARQLGQTPWWILAHSWPHAIDRYLVWDVAVNVALYLPLGIFGFLAMSPRVAGTLRVLAPLALAWLLSSCVEMLQLFDDSRTCSGGDVVCNVAGAAWGIAAGALYRSLLRRTPSGSHAAPWLRPSGAVLLLGCWFGYQLFPLFPTWGRSNLWRRIAALWPVTGLALVPTLVVFAEWITVACLLDSLFKVVRPRRWLTVLLVLVPARLFIANRVLAWPDVIGAAGAWLAWMCLPRVWVRRAAPILLAAAVVLAELSPFRFRSAHGFDWVPFRGLFRTSWQDGFVVLFRKSFWYGSLIWLWQVAGGRFWITTAAVAVALLATEFVQVHLPGRTAEITDAVLAALMGLLLWLLRAS
jgi:VanZ family protein